MDYFNETLRLRRLDSMKRNARLPRAVNIIDIQTQVKEASEWRNHMTCQTEHLWYVARATERIAKAMEDGGMRCWGYQKVGTAVGGDGGAEAASEAAQMPDGDHVHGCYQNDNWRGLLEKHDDAEASS